jgi:methyl-accepting chemotaxis protein
VNPLLRPAVRLMNRLRYARKFVLISLLFAAPLGLTLYLWLAELQQRIAFAEKERAGLAYVSAVHRVLEAPLLGRQADVAAADLDSYYLMDAVVTRLPELAAQLGAISQAARPVAKLGVAQAALDGIGRGHAVVLRENPGLRAALEPSLAELGQAFAIVAAGAATPAASARAQTALSAHQRAVAAALD